MTPLEWALQLQSREIEAGRGESPGLRAGIEALLAKAPPSSFYAGINANDLSAVSSERY